ncbi:methyltransferase domain-containing protein [Streptomyces hoynatensis]|uniref:methyltransferase domain-containing protein n=1 Tax=Streptomyces hoynatensis TaxID=1141874 RepID=UPI001319B9D1|nr:methyltransferase domain-containing protein [Streptomyces hoynatensis]
MANRRGDNGAAAFAVPRHHFIPTRAWARPTAGVEGYWIDRERDPDRWWGAVCSDTVIVTQIDEGRTELTEENVRRTFSYTCSSTGPSLVFALLGLLDADREHRVLEIGTGTGWTAALLSRLAGDEHVTTVEIDPVLAVGARDNLARAGFAPHLVVGDGADGVSARAPFDRVHVTCGVSAIPYPWIAQTRPGGIIVLPWSGNHRALRLTVGEDGTAIGDFHGECAFMPLRGGRRATRHAGIPEGAREREVTTDVRRIVALSPGWWVCLAELVGAIPAVSGQGDEGLLAVLSAGMSHARVHLAADGTARVTQRGPRNLWDEAEEAHRKWTEWGCPDIGRFGMRVTPERQYVWLDDPSRPLKE